MCQTQCHSNSIQKLWVCSQQRNWSHWKEVFPMWWELTLPLNLWYLYHKKAILWWLLLKGSCISSRLINLIWLSIKQSSSLSGTKIQGGTQRFFSAGAITYLGVCLFFFAFGAAKVTKTISLLLGQWVHPLLSSSEYEYSRFMDPLNLWSS